METEKDYFINGKKDEEDNVEIVGCVANGISKGLQKKYMPRWCLFAEYAFNKSHAAAYAVIAYQTAYLKPTIL